MPPIKLLIKFSSLICWKISLGDNSTEYFRESVLFALTLIKKHPSPEVKAAIQIGLIIFWGDHSGLSTGLVKGKASFSFSVSPKLIVARLFTISWRPASFKCCPFSFGDQESYFFK